MFRKKNITIVMFRKKNITIVMFWLASRYDTPSTARKFDCANEPWVSLMVEY
jgi:hypothetical protein